MYKVKYILWGCSQKPQYAGPFVHLSEAIEARLELSKNPEVACYDFPEEISKEEMETACI